MTTGRRTAQLIAAITALFGATLAVPNVSSAATRNPDNGSNLLPSGHCLRANRHNSPGSLRSRSDRFDLTLFRTGQFTMDNDVEVPGAGFGYGYSDIWGFVPHKIGSSATVCMRPHGDLVLHAGTRRLWHTRTGSKAAGGYAKLLNSGRLVVRNVHGRTVWSSRTTAVVMIAGDRLESGKTLVNRTYPGSVSRLEMRRSGDLVLVLNHTRVWHTDTHVRGSFLKVTHRGRLAVRTPAGQQMWNTPAYHHAVMRLAEQGRLILQNPKSLRCWQRPPHGDCSAG